MIKSTNLEMKEIVRSRYFCIYNTNSYPSKRHEWTSLPVEWDLVRNWIMLGTFLIQMGCKYCFGLISTLILSPHCLLTTLLHYLYYYQLSNIKDQQ